MMRAHTNVIARALALAGIVVACALVGVSEYGYQRSITATAQYFARKRSLYARCVADIRKSGEHQNLWDLEIDAKCPVKPSEQQLRIAASVPSDLRGRALRLAGAILAICALPWATLRLTRINRR
jgi:hypothetical protein